MNRLLIALCCVPAIAIAAVLNFTGAAAAACPFCDVPTLLMSEQIQMCGHLLEGRWLGGDKPTEKSAGTSRFEILQVARSASDLFKVGQTIELPQHISGRENGHYALMGVAERLDEWHMPIEVTEASWTYLSTLPEPVTEPAKQTERLAFAISYLEHPELLISNDAYAEFAAAPYDVIVPVRDRLPREKLRTWVTSSDTMVTRMGLYGLLLGLCGTEEDAQIMEKKIVVCDADFRLGIEGVMSGFLLIRGEPGLTVIEDTKMKATTCTNAAGETINLPFSETYAAMQTLRFMWTYEPDRIPRERLKASMRILLERPDLADLVITDLSRWKDWDVQDRLMLMYDDEKYSLPAVKRAIVRFMYHCSQDKPAEGAEPLPQTVRAKHLLEELEKKDPKTVSDVRRYLVR
jgi:hypothetical protein